MDGQIVPRTWNNQSLSRIGHKGEEKAKSTQVNRLSSIVFFLCNPSEGRAKANVPSEQMRNKEEEESKTLKGELRKQSVLAYR